MAYSPLLLTVASLTTVAHASSGDFLNSLSVTDAANSPWEITGAASFGMTDGNSDSLTLALQLLAQYSEGNSEASVGADWLYSGNGGDAQTDSFRLHGNYNRIVTDRFYYGVKASYLTDQIAEIDYRIDLGSSLGYQLIKTDTTTFSLEVAPGIAWKNQGGLSRADITICFGQSFEHKMNDRTRLWQNLLFTPEADDFNHYILTAEAGIDTVLADHWALRTSLRYRYDSTPAAGRQPDDTALLLGFSYSLGGFENDGTRNAGSIGSGWDHSAAIGFSYLSGNSDSSSINLSADSALRTDQEEIFLDASYQFGENGGVISADGLRANAQYNRLLNDRIYYGASAGFLRDDLAGVNYRITPAATVGHYIIKKDDMTLSIEGGVGFTFEDVGVVCDDYFSIVTAQKFTWAVNERTTFKQSLSGVCDSSNSDNYTLVADAALEVKLTEKTAWRLAASWAYDNVPAVGREKDDTTLTSGLSIQF